MADSKLSDLTAASALTGSELFYSDNGVADVKVTATQIKALTLGTANVFTKAQTFQPDSDAQAGTFRRNSAGQTSKVLEIQTEANGFLAGFNAVGALSISNGTLTASNPSLDLSQTWNASGVNFTGLRFNAAGSSDANSAAGSLLLDLQVGGTSVFNVTKGGSLKLGVDATGTNVAGSAVNIIGSRGTGNAAGGSIIFQVAPAGSSGTGQNALISPLQVLGTGGITGVDGATANTLAIRNGTTAQSFRVYGTADGSPGANFERLSLKASTVYSGGAYHVISAEAGGTGAANQNIVIQALGTGAFMLKLPDGTTTGGNARGAYAVDLQLASPAVATRVASGDYAIAIGANNTASNTASVSIGNSSLASGGYSVSLGANNTSSGTYSFSAGYNGTASGNYSVMLGSGSTASTSYAFALGYQSLSNRYGLYAYASGQFASGGDAQKVTAVLRCKTTTNTAVEMALDGGTTYLTIPSGKVMSGLLNIHGVKSDGSAVAHYMRQMSIKNVGGTTTLVASQTVGTDTAAGTSIDVTANDTGDYLSVKVTGVASETWRWTAYVDASETAYGS